MRYSLLVLLLPIAPSTTFAGTTGKITGQVTDQNGDPLPGAAIFIEGTKRGTFADEEGIYFLLSVDPGKHTLTASIVGYEALQQQDVLVTSDFTTNINFTLKEQALPLGEIVVEAQAGESKSWGMFSIQATTPPVEPDKTTSIYTIRAEDIEALPIVRLAEEFIELQAGVSVSENGDEIVVRAGDPEDVAYFLDGIPILSTDNAITNIYRDFNRLSIQEMTIVTGGLNAEYGNAQGGVVKVVTREGQNLYSGLMDYQLTPPGQKHWGQNAYDSPIHEGNNQWDNPAWVSERVTLPNGRVISAHKRRDYTGFWGHYLEGNLSGPLKKNLTFFLSSRWQKKPSAFPNADMTTPPNINTTGKLSYLFQDNVKLIFGALYDYRQVANNGPDEGGRLNIKNNGKNLFLSNPKPTGDGLEKDQMLYAGLTDLLSPKTFYDVRIAHSISSRDTTNVPLPTGISHISEAFADNPIKDQALYYTVYRQAINWDRYRNQRWILNVSISSQVNKQNHLKTGLEIIRYNNWFQRYRSPELLSESPAITSRQVRWMAKSYEDTDFFPDKHNRGLNPIQMGFHAQDKIEINGMIIQAGLRHDLLLPNMYVNEIMGFYPTRRSPMWGTMTRARNMPTIKAPKLDAWSPRLGISHPVTEQSVLRFFYGKFAQFPSFEHLFAYAQSYVEDGQDIDLNQNGTLDPAERWNNLGTTPLHANAYLIPETTSSFEVGFDWNFTSDYVLSLTTYYKGANNQITGGAGWWEDPILGAGSVPSGRFINSGFIDTRGLELNLKKKFSHLFAFNFALNLQWSDQGRVGSIRRDHYPDSLLIANGHYWTQHDVDPVTGKEIPVSLQEMAIREGLAPDHYIKEYGALANERIRERAERMPSNRQFYWFPNLGHYAEGGIDSAPNTPATTNYSEDDRKFWDRINNTQGYPGTGEGNLLVSGVQESVERSASIKDRRSFGSLTFLFATPSKFGPLNGRILGNFRTNLVYRFYTGTPFEFIPLILNTNNNTPVGGAIDRDYGPIHTRMDMNIEKQFGNIEKVHFILGLEIYNLFNQKDTRSFAPEVRESWGTTLINTRAIDFDPQLWKTYGIDGLQPVSANNFGPREVHDINNYWDSPREMKFSIRVKW